MLIGPFREKLVGDEKKEGKDQRRYTINNKNKQKKLIRRTMIERFYF
jgi:hypothetical protein